MPPDWRPSDEGLPQGAVHAGRRPAPATRRCARRYERPLLDHPGRRRPGAADRVRQHRQPAARARDGAAARAERAAGARRVAMAAGAAAARARACCSPAAARRSAFSSRRWGSRLLVRQLSTQTNTVFLDLSLDWRVLAFTSAVAVLTALLFGTAAGVARGRRRADGGARRSTAAAASGSDRSPGVSSPAGWSSRRSRCRSCWSSPPGCSCGRSARSRSCISGSIAIACCSSTSTRSGPRFRRPIAWRPTSASARRGVAVPASPPPRSRSSRRSAAAPGTTRSKSPAASPLPERQRIVELQLRSPRLAHDVRHAADRRTRHSPTAIAKARRRSSSSTRRSRRNF